MTRPVVFSASSVAAYQRCHLEWYFGYVAVEHGLETEPQRVGIQVHEYAERKLRVLRQEATLGFRGEWDQPRDTSNRPEVKALLRVFDNDILPTYRKPALIEAGFQLEFNGIPFSGILDSVDQQDVPWGYANILRDLKTSQSRPSRAKYRFAMTGYWHGAADLGYEPSAAQLDWIVRTKHPYYWPEMVEPLPLDVFARELEVVAEGVGRGDYAATGLGTWACKACPFNQICGPYQRYKEINGEV